MVQELKTIGYIDMTPTWLEILPSWKLIVDDATKTLKPDQVERFWIEMQRMAESADRYSFLLETMRGEGYDDEAVQRWLDNGKEALIARRNTIKPVEAA